MNKKLTWGLIIAVIVIILLFLGVSSNSKSKEGLNKVGVISSMSGDFAKFGQEFTNGILLASEIHNKENIDNQINIIVENDEFDSKKALSAYKKITGLDNVDAIINFSTPSINGIYDLVQADDKIILQLGEQAQEPTDDLVYGLFPGSIIAEEELGRSLKEKGYKKPLIVYTIDDTAVRFKNAVVKGFGSEVKEVGISVNEKDMRTHASKILNEDFDILINVMFPVPGAQLIVEILKQNSVLPQMAFDTIMSGGIQDYKDILGDLKSLDGSIVATFSANKSSKLDEFIKLYTERFGNEPGYLADIGYDALNILIDTYDDNPKKWKENTQNLSYEGANGLYKFDEVGLRIPSTLITTIQNGEIVN
jgi:branched-chain amino acid transport system substrate-binding protein